MSLSLYAAGSNGQGQLATGNCDDAHTFQPCTFLGCQPNFLPPGTTSIETIVGGGNHTLILLSREHDDSSGAARRELWGSGDGGKGQLGPGYVAEAGNETAIFRPVRLPLDEQPLTGHSVKTVAACWETSYVVLEKEGASDVLISMGGDDYGDLGVGGLNGKGKAKERNATSFHVVDVSGAVSVRAQLTIVKRIAAGPHHAVVHLQAVYPDGSVQEHVVGWGASRHGQLGKLLSPAGRPLPFVATPQPIAFDEPSHPVLDIRLGNQHSVFLHSSGRVSALGTDKKNQIQGLSDVHDIAAIGCTWNGTYVLAPYEGAAGELALHSVGSHARGQLGRPYAEGAGPQPVEFPFAPSSRILKRFACGSEHMLALFSSKSNEDGEETETEVWGWGWNEHGNLGTGTLDDIPIPVKIWPALSPNLSATTDRVLGLWTGCGTSWIAVGRRDPATE